LNFIIESIIQDKFLLSSTKKERKRRNKMETEAARLIAAAIALLPILGVGIALGNIFASYNNAISRNPEAESKLSGTLLFGFAVTEALAIFCLGLSVIILLGVLG
jgi:F-type H+-transporting ATPase subunit c